MGSIIKFGGTAGNGAYMELLDTGAFTVVNASGTTILAVDANGVMTLPEEVTVDALFRTASTELTISAGGAVAITQDFHTIDTAGDSASDDLDSLTGGTASQIVMIRPESAARTVVLKHAIGANLISCPGGRDISLAESTDWALLLHNGTQWAVIAQSCLSQSATFAAATITTLTATTVNSALNGTLGATTPAAATVTTLASSGLHTASGGVSGVIGATGAAAGTFTTLTTTTAQLTTVGVGAAAGSGVTAVEHGNGTLHKTILTFVSTPVVMADNAGVVAYGSLKVYDFPAGLIFIATAVADLDLTLSAAGINADWDGDFGVGTVAADNTNSLASTEQNIINSTATPQAVASATTANGVSGNVGAIDGTGTAVDLYFNLIVDDADHDVTGTPTNVLLNGTLTVIWANGGDF